MVVLGGMGNVWGVTVGALLLAWTNSTGCLEAQIAIDDSRRRQRRSPSCSSLVGIALARHRSGAVCRANGRGCS